MRCKVSWYTFGVSQPFDLGFVTSYILPPWLILVCRFVISIALAVGIILGLVFAGDTAGDTFSFFTWLSYWGLFWYYIIATVYSADFVFSKQRRYLLAKAPKFIQFLHTLLFATIINYPYLVTIVYWTVLTSGDDAEDPLGTAKRRFSNIQHHALNTAWSFLELIVFSRTKSSTTPWVHMVFLIVILALYLGLAYLTYATKGFYVYSFLDPVEQGPLLAAYICGILIGVIILYIIIKLIIYGKNKFGEKRYGLDGYCGQKFPHTKEAFQMRGGV